MTSQLDELGFEMIPSFLNFKEISDLRTALESLAIAPGHRDLMRRVPEVTKLALSPKIRQLLRGRTGKVYFPVRAIFFDKTPESNWLVPWHQDLTIAVVRQLDRPGYGSWSLKNGVPHVQPPLEILESIVTVRLHLDEADQVNGALRVIPGSHRLGRLDASTIATERSRTQEVLCSAQCGDALLMRPLLLHASSPASNPSHRRVIHLEFAACMLAGGLEWAETTDNDTGCYS